MTDKIGSGWTNNGFGGGSERVNIASADAHGRWGLCVNLMRAIPLATAGGSVT